MADKHNDKVNEKTATTDTPQTDAPQTDKVAPEHVAAQQFQAGVGAWMQTWQQMTEATLAASRQLAGQMTHPWLAPVVAQAGKMVDDHMARVAGVEAEYVKAEQYGLAQMTLACDEMARLGKAGLQWYGAMAAQGRQQAHDAVHKAQETVRKAKDAVATAGVAS